MIHPTIVFFLFQHSTTIAIFIKEHFEFFLTKFDFSIKTQILTYLRLFLERKSEKGVHLWLPHCHHLWFLVNSFLKRFVALKHLSFNLSLAINIQGLNPTLSIWMYLMIFLKTTNQLTI